MDFDSLKDDLLSYADTGVKFALNNGADSAEIYVGSDHSINVRNQSGMIDARDGLNEGIGVRVAIGKKLGFAAMSSLTDESLKHCVSEAVSVAKSRAEEDDKFTSFAVKQPVSQDGVLDKTILDTPTEDIVNRANDIYSDAKSFDDRIISMNAQVQKAFGGYAVANSEGVSAASQYTAFVLVAFGTAMEGQNRKSAFEFSVTRKMPTDFAVGTKAAEKAVNLLNSKPLNHTGVLPTVWNPIIMSNYWGTSLVNSINGRQVVEKNSYFMDKLGDQVGVKDLSITDDGQLPEGLSTSAIDEEGHPRSTTKIIDKGVLQSFLYDDYYGKIGKAKSTGNASRAQSYESTPGISPTTVVVKPGSKSFDQMIAEIDKGVYIMDMVMGLGHSNLISGDFSVVATSAYLIEKGELKHALEPITVAGNLYKSYKNILHIGSDTKLLTSVKTPSIVFDGFTVNG